MRKGDHIENIWEDIRVFLDACITIGRDKPTYVELVAYEQTYKVNENKDVAQKIFKGLHDTFREGQTDPGIEDYPVHTYWDIDPKELHKVVDYMIRGQPWPTYSFCPIQLRMS